MTRQDIEKWFERDTADHEMKILHDDGLYRHLRFERKDGGGYWFSLTTWPQKLVINGSVGTYVFSRLEDMFEFFRTSRSTGGPNYSYWEEKIVAASEPAIGYSVELLQKQIAEYFEEAEAEKHWPGVAAAWDEKVNGFFAEYDLTNEYGARNALGDFTYKPDDAPEGDVPFQFYDVRDWDLQGYDWKYLWSCHAIVWGVAQYDAAKAAAPQPEAVSA